jgi:Spy/CpxP family protein refolding chaperone
MNKMTKIALATASVLSVGALTACQSTQAPKDMEQSQHMHSHYQKDRHMTPEQREQFEKMRTERKQVMQDIKKACDGKAVGSAVQVKAGEQTLEGTCAISYSV